MSKKGKIKINKILFYTHTPRAFRSTLIGNLYEIAQVYPTILLSEELDPETQRILEDKNLFPKLEEIIPVRQMTGVQKNIYSQNKYLCKLARTTIEKYRPDVVMSGSDNYSLFELYLFRYAKKINAVGFVLQFALMGEARKDALFVDLLNAYLHFPRFLPFQLRMFLTKVRKYCGYFLYHWFLPLFVGNKPFLGKESYVLKKGSSGMRDSDFQFVFTERDYNMYFVNGVPETKLYILEHPMARRISLFSKYLYSEKFKIKRENGKSASLMLPGSLTIGFKNEDYSLISEKEREKDWIETIKIVKQTLPSWKIYIKPHPSTKDIARIKEIFESISDNVVVTDPNDLADKYIEIGNIVVGLSMSASTALFTASLQCPEKPIISLDFKQELFGDFYKHFPGIEYVSNQKDFISLLERIKMGEYKKSDYVQREELGGKKFNDTISAVNTLYLIKKTNKA
jgi:hypothetical protein